MKYFPANISTRLGNMVNTLVNTEYSQVVNTGKFKSGGGVGFAEAIHDEDYGKKRPMDISRFLKFDVF